jgi:hypothetical protein
MKFKQLFIVVILAILSAMVVYRLLPLFSNLFSEVLSIQEKRPDLTSLAPLNREELYQAIGDKKWRLKSLHTESGLTKPIKNSEPSVWMSDNRVVSFDLGCNITYSMTDTGTELGLNKYFINEDGQINFLTSDTASRFVYCNNGAGELEKKLFAPAVGKQGQFYLQGNNLLLHFIDTDTHFVFR